MNSWIRTDQELPPKNVEVETMIADRKGKRNQTTLIHYEGLWFFPDMSIYVYYTPTHWRYTKKEQS